MLLELGHRRPLQRRVRQALPAEVLGRVADFWSGRKVHRRRAQHRPVPKNGLLRHAVPERLFAVQHLVEDDAHRPDVDLARHRDTAMSLKAFGRQVPVRARTLRRELDR